MTRVYHLRKQPPVAFALEVGSRTTLRQDVGPKVELYQEKVKAAEYCHIDLDWAQKRLWRLGPDGYQPVAPEANGRLRSLELAQELDLEDDLLRVYTFDGERLRSHEESEQQLEMTAQRLEVTEQRLEATEQQLAEEARQRQEAEQQAEEEARRRQEAEERAAELERQIAELRAQRVDPDGSSP